MSAARTRPCSSRKVLSTWAAAVIPYLSPLYLIPQGADLHRAILCVGNLFRPAKRLVEVLAFKQKESTQLLVRFGEGTIRDQRFAFPYAHSRRIGDRGKPIVR